MFRETRQLPKTFCASAALALVLGAGTVADVVDFGIGIVPDAHAAQPGGGRGERAPGAGDARGSGIKQGGRESGRGGKSMTDVLADEEEEDGPPDWAKGNKEPGPPNAGDPDSDRPAWAQGNKEANPHRGEQPRVPGSKMGDLFGDLWVILRADDGSPIYVKWIWTDDGDEIVEAGEVSFGGFCTVGCDVNGDGIVNELDGWFVQPLAADGTISYDAISGKVPSAGADGVADLIPLDAEGKPLVVYQDGSEANVLVTYEDSPEEVDIGRANVARSPSKVITHALDEALAKVDGLTYDPTATDPAGRLTYVVDGVTYTIDSPLENLALYKAVLEANTIVSCGTTSCVKVSYGEDTFLVPVDERLDLAASLLAAASDKTGTMTVDYVMNVSQFLGVADELVALVDSYTYDRNTEYGGYTVSYLVANSSGGFDVVTVPILNLPSVTTLFAWSVLPSTVDEGDADQIPNDTDWVTGITGFAQTADDALQVLEFVHEYSPPVLP
jgi:hypothetical protein